MLFHACFLQCSEVADLWNSALGYPSKKDKDMNPCVSTVAFELIGRFMKLEK
jgi:hypothetical protein